MSVRLPVVALALGLVACRHSSSAEHARASSNQAVRDSTATPVVARQLTVNDIPGSALAALRDSFPNFSPLDTAEFTSDERARFRRSADEGLVVLRGDFQGKGSTDFVVAGRGQRPLVIALLVDSLGHYSAVTAFAVAGDQYSRFGLERVASEDTVAGNPRMDIRLVALPPISETDGAPVTLTWSAVRHTFLIVSDGE